MFNSPIGSAVPHSGDSYSPSLEQVYDDVMLRSGLAAQGRRQSNLPLSEQGQIAPYQPDVSAAPTRLAHKHSLAALSCRLRKMSFGKQELKLESALTELPRHLMSQGSGKAEKGIGPDARVGTARSITFENESSHAAPESIVPSGRQIGTANTLKKKLSGFLTNWKPMRSSQSEMNLRVKRQANVSAVSSAWPVTDEHRLLAYAIESLKNVLDAPEINKFGAKTLTQAAIVEAISHREWEKVNAMLFEHASPLRGLPLGAKNIVLMAHRFPDACQSPSFQHALALSRGLDRPATDPKKCDPIFNPGEQLRQFIETKQNGTQAELNELIAAVNNGFEKARELQAYLNENQQSLLKD